MDNDPKTLLIVFPTTWDQRQLAACREAWEPQYRVLYAEPDDETCPWDLDMAQYIEDLVKTYGTTIDGVLSSSDYPGATVAAALATRLGLPGSSPDRVIETSHKYYSRLVQREAVPESTPGFTLVDPAHPGEALDTLRYPCFIKPVKGAFSIMTRKLRSPEDLEQFLGSPAVREFSRDYVHIFNQLVGMFTGFEFDGGHFVAEEFVTGQQVTVEGFVREGRVEILGVVDSVMYPHTSSFARFDYPSALHPGIQDRMRDVADRVIQELGLADTLFNIEMVHDAARDRIFIIEVNPRICGQFADLYQKVDGFNSYEVALALAAGDRPRLPRRAGAYRRASSFPLRVFEPVRVTRAPEDADIRAAEAIAPGTMLWSECTTGQEMADFQSVEDGQSVRYAVVNLGARDQQGLFETLQEVQSRAGFAFEPLAGRDLVLRTATPEDLGPVRTLLRAVGLAEAGFAGRFGEAYVLLEKDGTPVGTAGVEIHGTLGLLRSVAVLPQRQRSGLGARLVEDRLAWARNHGLDALYLLTETAAPFFARLGFSPVDRSQVPESIRNTSEFADFCPASATVMVRELRKS